MLKSTARPHWKGCKEIATLCSLARRRRMNEERLQFEKVYLNSPVPKQLFQLIQDNVARTTWKKIFYESAEQEKLLQVCVCICDSFQVGTKKVCGVGVCKGEVGVFLLVLLLPLQFNILAWIMHQVSLGSSQSKQKFSASRKETQNVLHCNGA